MPKFVVTKLAGKEVAGLRNPGAGAILELSELQAEHPLRVGHIVRRKQEEAKAEPQKPAKA